MSKKLFLFAIIISVLQFFSGCGSSGSSSGGLSNSTTVTGTCKTSNGDPVPGATVSIPSSGTATSVSKVVRLKTKALAAADGTACNDPTQTACASTCTNADGSFSLATTGCAGTESDLVMQKGTLKKILNLNCSGSDCILSSDESTFGSSDGTTTYPKVAVVTGTYDRMQDVLAKIAPSAYGTVNSTTNQLTVGTENQTNLTLIDGDGTLDATYSDFSEYLNGTKSLTDFDVVFINCGDDYEDTLTDTDAANVKQRISDYVNNGGSLYVTDLSYDFVNQVFPSFMNFEGDVDASTTGAVGEAQTGTSSITVDAAVNDTNLKSWLANVAVNQHDANTPGNPDNDCSGTYTTRTSALTSGGLLPLGDFLSGWAHMVGIWSGSSTSILVSSGSGTVFDNLDNRPLTVMQTIASGRVIYSSYHTASECPTPNFWPQERVLQYLILEAF